MIGLHGDDVRTQLARLARKRAGLDAERLGGVAGRDRNGGIGSGAAVPSSTAHSRHTFNYGSSVSLPNPARGVESRCGAVTINAPSDR
jgi:hypothetical protein